MFLLVQWVETNRRQNLTPQDCHAFCAAHGKQSYRDSSPSVIMANAKAPDARRVARHVWAQLRSSTHSQGSRGTVNRPHFCTDTPDGYVWVSELSRASLQNIRWVAVGVQATELRPRLRHLWCYMTLISHLTSASGSPRRTREPTLLPAFLAHEHSRLRKNTAVKGFCLVERAP